MNVSSEAKTRFANQPDTPSGRIAVIIPCFRVRAFILSVLAQIGSEVEIIYVIDDCCPESSGNYVQQNTTDARIRVLYNKTNLGVGGATITGFQQAARDGADVLVKLDGDGQMNPRLILNFVNTILAGEADYAKGNRFFDLDGLASMPTSRLLGNAGLSFLAKISTGYWHSFDPTNGYIALHASLLPLLPVEKISQRYFFESDLLFRLNVLNARVIDIPMHAHYGEEVSNMKPYREIPRFAGAHLRNLVKRILYNYFIRNFSIASLELILGMLLVSFGSLYGLANWGFDAPATAGTVMIAALPIIVGVQLILAFLSFDIQSVPSAALHRRLQSSHITLKALRHGNAGPQTGNTRNTHEV